MQTLLNILSAFWATLAEMAPWLIFGFIAAGVLSVFFSTAFIERHLGGRGFWPVLKSAVLGVPLPICSCGVIPVSASLYRHGASKGATSSFLLSTPQTGVDSIFATYALMGPVFAIVRPIIALLNGIFGGLLIDAADRRPPETQNISTPRTSEESDLSLEVAETPATPDVADSDCGGGSCCGSTPPETKTQAKWKRVLRYGLITLPADIAVSLVLGLGVAALISALVPADALAPYLGGGLLAMGAAVLVGAPLYVCATGSIPIAMGLLAAGASPGAVLAFLIAGPATNAATISVTWDLLGRRTGLLYLLSVVVTAVGSGLLLDATFTLKSLHFPEIIDQMHHHGMAWSDHLWAALMLGLLVPALWNRLKPRRTTPSTPGDTNAAPLPADTTLLSITGMTCSHCVDAVERGLREVRGVREAQVDLKAGTATVRGEASTQQLREAVAGLGYGVNA